MPYLLHFLVSEAPSSLLEVGDVAQVEGVCLTAFHCSSEVSG